MAHQSLYRRYRPGTFADVVGQDHVIAALRNAVRDGRVGHAYLFSGPRGTGKTSTARILAKALNCENPVDGDPDGTCASCVAITAGTSYDLHELDAASNNKVDDIRDLIAKVALGSPGRMKVYILDEVHMLTGGAENALLKTLEEPPDHVVFVLATTEPHKVVPTIRSRTQHLRFELLGSELLESHVRAVADDAGLEVTDADVAYVLRAGGGSVRDTLSALDEVVASGGAPDDIEAIEEIVDAIAGNDTGRALAGVQAALVAGRDPRVIAEQCMSRLRDAFLVEMGGIVDHVSESELTRARSRARSLGAPGLTRALETLGTAAVDMRQAPDPRVDIELALVRLTRPQMSGDLAGLTVRVERLEAGSPQGVSPQGVTPQGVSPQGVTPQGVSPQGVTPQGVSPQSDVIPPAGDPAPPAPVPDSGDKRLRPADAARARLGTKASAPPPREERPTATPEPEPESESESESESEPEPEPEPTPPPATPSEPAPAPSADPVPAQPTPAVASAGGQPTRDDVALAWGDVVLPSLPPKVRSRFAGGRFLPDNGDTIVFGLPNAIHRDRCEDVRVDVDKALAAHFGQPVALRLEVDDGSAPPAGSTDGPSADDDGDDDNIDLEDLVDAPSAERSGLETLTKTFPGAEILDPDET
jgi:DNA polymerase-3 subunit gamma/tau